jgi:hypothetical protein
MSGDKVSPARMRPKLAHSPGLVAGPEQRSLSERSSGTSRVGRRRRDRAERLRRDFGREARSNWVSCLAVLEPLGVAADGQGVMRVVQRMIQHGISIPQNGMPGGIRPTICFLIDI